MNSVTASVLLCALFAISFAQMTFTDQWTKKSFMTNSKSTQTEPKGSGVFRGSNPQDQEMCSAATTNEVLAQLERVHAVQAKLTAYLNACYRS